MKYGVYGNIHMSPPLFLEEKYLLADQLEKNLIDQKTYDWKLRNLKRHQLMFIAVTNGGYNIKTKGKYKKKSLTEQRDIGNAQTLKSIQD